MLSKNNVSSTEFKFYKNLKGYSIIPKKMIKGVSFSQDIINRESNRTRGKQERIIKNNIKLELQ